MTTPSKAKYADCYHLLKLDRINSQMLGWLKEPLVEWILTETSCPSCPHFFECKS